MASRQALARSAGGKALVLNFHAFIGDQHTDVWRRGRGVGRRSGFRSLFRLRIAAWRIEVEAHHLLESGPADIDGAVHPGLRRVPFSHSGMDLELDPLAIAVFDR
jgi:hypothetical protein